MSIRVRPLTPVPGCCTASMHLLLFVCVLEVFLLQVFLGNLIPHVPFFLQCWAQWRSVCMADWGRTGHVKVGCTVDLRLNDRVTRS